jgi:NTE family protein
LIEAGRFTAALAPESKIKPDLELLTYLHGVARLETEKWLERYQASIGVKSTVDLAQHFLATRASLSSEDSQRAAARSFQEGASEK